MASKHRRIASEPPSESIHKRRGNVFDYHNAGGKGVWMCKSVLKNGIDIRHGCLRFYAIPQKVEDSHVDAGGKPPPRTTWACELVWSEELEDLSKVRKWTTFVKT